MIPKQQFPTCRPVEQNHQCPLPFSSAPVNCRTQICHISSMTLPSTWLWHSHFKVVLLWLNSHGAEQTQTEIFVCVSSSHVFSEFRKMSQCHRKQCPLGQSRATPQRAFHCSVWWRNIRNAQLTQEKLSADVAALKHQRVTILEHFIQEKSTSSIQTNPLQSAHTLRPCRTAHTFLGISDHYNL